MHQGLEKQGSQYVLMLQDHPKQIGGTISNVTIRRNCNAYWVSSCNNTLPPSSHSFPHGDEGAVDPILAVSYVSPTISIHFASRLMIPLSSTWVWVFVRHSTQTTPIEDEKPK
jgi:hypothetical protein